MKIYIHVDAQPSGPFSKEELQQKVYSGELSRTVSACLEGGTDWVPLESLLGGGPVGTAPSTLPPVLRRPANPVNEEQLRDPKERTALMWLYIASGPAWLFLAIWTLAGFGIPLIFIGLFWLIHLFGELWFAAYLKTNAVRVSKSQLPELDRVVEACCASLQMERPDVYVMQQNVWNAFAAKLFGRRVVVLLSGAVDSILLKGDLAQLTWVVGHELGHHWAGHLNFSQRLANLGGWLIWVNLWHSRRRELTCDRVGLFCAGSVRASRLALLNATVGAQMASWVNADEAVNQWLMHRDEFFVKYRTLYSTHPHLLARLEHLNLAAAELGLAAA